MQLVDKLKMFNWKADKPRIWPSCKFGVQVTTYCMSVSFFMTIWAAIVYGENAMGLLVCLLAVHFFAAIITVGELGEISSIQSILVKIEPDSDILSKSERLKTKYILYCLRVALVIIAIGVAVNLQVVLFSGAIFALSGAIFTCIFSYKVRKLFPIDFIKVVSFYMWGMRRSKGDSSYSSNLGVNPSNGLPVINSSFDTGGSLWRRVSGLHDVHMPFENDSVTSLPFENELATSTSFLLENNVDEFGAIKFNPASGLPMMNDTFDINGDVFGTTSHYYDDHHNWDNHHSQDNSSWDNHWDSHDRW